MEGSQLLPDQENVEEDQIHSKEQKDQGYRRKDPHDNHSRFDAVFSMVKVKDIMLLEGLVITIVDS